MVLSRNFPVYVRDEGTSQYLRKDPEYQSEVVRLCVRFLRVRFESREGCRSYDVTVKGGSWYDLTFGLLILRTFLLQISDTLTLCQELLVFRDIFMFVKF